MAKAATSIKVVPETHAKLQEIARNDNRTIGEVITILVEKYEKEQFWQGVSEDLEKLKADEEGYRHYRDEFAEWDNQTTQSLTKEPPYYAEGEE